MVIPFTGVIANLQAKGIDISTDGSGLTNALVAIQPNLITWSYSFPTDTLYIELPNISNISSQLTTFGTPDFTGVTG